MIETHEVEQSGMKLVDVNAILRSAQPNRIGLAVSPTSARARSGDPTAIAPRIVVTPLALLTHRHAAELSAPNDQRIVQQPTPFQIGQQSGDRLVGLLALGRMVPVNILVRVPAFGVARIDLHETHTTLDHATC